MDNSKLNVKFYQRRWFSATVILVVVLIAGSMLVNAYNGMQTAAQSALTAGTQVAQPTTLLTLSGNGSKSTQTFTAPSSWDLAYTYDCSKFGQPGNFQAFFFKGDGTMAPFVGPNEQGMKGGDTDYYHSAGTYYLEVNTECSWTVTVQG